MTIEQHRQAEARQISREAAADSVRHTGPTADRYESAMQRYLTAMAPPTEQKPEPHLYYNRSERVADVMTVGVVAAHQEASFKEIVRSLARNRISSIPVVDDEHRVVGIVSESDLLARMVSGGPNPLSHRHTPSAHAARRRKEHAETAGELMTAPAVCIHPNVTVLEAARVAAKARVRRMPVIDADGKLVGIVSRADLLSMFLRSDADLADEIGNQVIVSRMALDPATVELDVHDGIVALRGTLERRLLVVQLQELVQAVEGVVAVRNEVGYRYDDTILPVPAHPMY